MVETTGFGVLIIVLVMAIVTLITRWGGVYVMSYVPISYRVKQFISAMSGSVLIALLAPLALSGEYQEFVEKMRAAITILLIKKPLPAIALGILAAALYRQI